jgi:hypothetical protein
MVSLHKQALKKMELLGISESELPVIYKHESIDALARGIKPTSRFFMIMSDHGSIHEEAESIKLYSHMQGAKYYQGNIEVADIVKGRLHKFCGLSRKEQLSLIAKGYENSQKNSDIVDCLSEPTQ